MTNQRLGRLSLMLTIWLAVQQGTAGAADYKIVASGPFVSDISEAVAFDGTTTTALPLMLNMPAVRQGTFTATFYFNTVTPASGSLAGYALSSTSGMTYELRDQNGAILHSGTNFSDADALVANNNGAPPFSVDQVLLSSNVNNVSGAMIPTPLYSQPPDLISIADFNVAGYATGGNDYLQDLSIPTLAATYLSFPNRNFDVLMEFGDGDYLNRVSPYQYSAVQATFEISSLTVTPVPEPFVSAGLLVMTPLLLLRRGLRRPAGNRVGG